MARQGKDGTVVHSSIALLQERFKKLQREKEIREERELLRRMIHGSERVSIPAAYYEPTGLFLHSGWTASHNYERQPHPPQYSMCLHPNLQSKQSSYLQVSDETRVMRNVCSSSVAVMDRTNNFDDSDVDTSLRL
ncbi:uncharacterized protein LOC125472180 [Pyrus x bretschneideri]|uniref:uncharacterized protein LOC125472180 n=1 Tax=Pyrus x bretschneideri TaxID=225117 RepID=UPI00202F1A39|nr:uncharacterized protein LOC125472180 [Pyrus x bretschneideri]